jgi:hypothetical protein
MEWCRERFKTTLVPAQIAPNGNLPLELARTKPYSCSLWAFSTPDGRGLKNLIEFIYPFMKDRNAWPFAHDVEHFEDFPVRNPALLFSGLAYKQQDYITLWKKLNPDPTIPEVIRNFPIRQTLLWLAKA